MAILEPLIEVLPVLVDAFEAADVGLEVIDVSQTIYPALTAIDEAGGEELTLSTLDAQEADLATRLGTGAFQTIEQQLTATKTALEAGDVLPGNIRQAMAWVLAYGGSAVVVVSAAALYALNEIYHLWGYKTSTPTTTAVATGQYAKQGVALEAQAKAAIAQAKVAEAQKPASPAPKPITTTPPATTTTPVPAPITVGITVPEPASPGGKLVTAAQKLIKQVTVRVPGLTAAEGKGIGTAIAQAYQDVLTVIVNVLNTVETQITNANKSITTLQNDLKTLKATETADNKVLTAEVKPALQRIAALDNTTADLTKTVTALQTEVIQLQTQQPPTTGIATQPTPSDLPGQVATIETIIPTLATVAALTQVEIEAQNAALIANNTAQTLATEVPPNLPTDLQTLDDCCEENSAVTGPINEGVTPTTPLSSLANLLKYIYAFGILATLLDVLLAILDMPDTIAGTMLKSGFAAQIADAAANASLADLSWSSTFAGSNAA